MAARWLLAMPPPRSKVWTESEPNPAVDAALAQVLDRLYEMPLNMNAHDARDPRPIGFSHDAKTVLVAFLNEHNLAHEQFGDEESAAWAKLESYCPRLALILHLANWAGNGGAGQPGAIPVQTLRAAVRLTKWFAKEALRVYGMLSETPDGRPGTAATVFFLPDTACDGDKLPTNTVKNGECVAVASGADGTDGASRRPAVDDDPDPRLR